MFGTVGPVMFGELICIDPLRLFTWCALCGAIMIIPGPVELLSGAAAQAWATGCPPADLGPGHPCPVSADAHGALLAGIQAAAVPPPDREK